MKCVSTQEIAVLYNPQRKEFYARIETTQSEIISNYYDMTEEDMLIMAEAYPDRVNDFFNNSLSDRLVSKINELISEYNNSHKKQMVRWLICDFREHKNFVQINDKRTCDELENKRGSVLLDIGYEGDYDFDKMTAFAQKYAQSSEYCVVECNKCGEFCALRLNNGKAICKCGNIYKKKDAIAVSRTLAGAVERAVELALEKEKNDSVDLGNDEILIEPKPFYYKGNTYGFNTLDSEQLHKDLYKDYAILEIFTGDDVVIGLNHKYESYLAGLASNKISVQLFKERKKTIIEMRDRQMLVSDAFYCYLNKYGLTDGILRRKYEGKHYTFNSLQDYVKRLVTANPLERIALLSIYDYYSCKYFFKTYEPSMVELSRLIYETINRFVYIDDDKYIDFGKNFMSEIVTLDGKEGERGIFLQAIKSNEKFWESVKGAYTDDCDYITSCNDNYGWLSLMAFAIEGKRSLKYGEIEIENSEDGEKRLRKIIEMAYTVRTDRALKEYHDLTRLFELGIIDRLETLCNVKLNTGEFVINELRTLILPAKAIPDISTYLFCAQISLSDRGNVEIEYEGKLCTIFDHARAVTKNCAEDSFELKKFISNIDVGVTLEFIFDDIEARKYNLKNRFDKLVAEVDKLCSFNY